ncbi:ATP-dependent RNA helicase TDRD9 [Lamellibrachia satsuma]|nr:ATP-dependent RNA helicase TDRD9 [Lamellibrachia satsuma]
MSRMGTEVTLEQIDDWFKIGKKVKVESLPRSKVGGRELDPDTGRGVQPSRPDVFVPPYKRHVRIGNPNQTAYAHHYQQLDDDTMAQRNPLDLLEGAAGGESEAGDLERLEKDSLMSGMSSVLPPGGMTEEQAVQVYNNYNFSHKYDPNLSITQYHDEIISTIESNQVPQYILDHSAGLNRYCNIVVTQPRRIAAMSISKRVCQERGWQPGGICGHQVGMDKETSDDTRLTYCTTGVLLQKLINAKNMQQYTHIILDEVHERDQESDFCLLVTRKLLRTNSRDVKIVLMSATIDSQQFAQYFSLPVRGVLEAAPVMTVKGQSYTVSEYYLEDLHPLGDLPLLDPGSPGIPLESYKLVQRLIKQLDVIETQQYGADEGGFSQKRGSVLVFLPGLGEINDLDELLRQINVERKLEILPLHSSITLEEQVRVFRQPYKGVRKIILSTNIAESSITVSDVKYVIDFCLTKNLECDAATNYTSLQVQWASQANMAQRKGRAGRVSNGRVYRLVTRSFYADYIPEYGTPEMQRCPLDQLVLHVKVLDLGEPKAILGLALSPPNLDDIERTILMLKQVGALASLRSGAVNPHDGRLTFVGRVLASLPVDIRVGKLVMLGHVFGMLDEAIIIGASLSLKSFFARPFKKHLEAYRHKFGWARDSFSDCLAYLNAYNTWLTHKETEMFLTGQWSESQWAMHNYIQLRRIKEVAILIEDLKKRLAKFNIRVPTGPAVRRSTYAHTPEGQLVLKMVLCGAFYPNYFVKGESDEEEAMRFMSGRNPFTTVMVKGLPSNQGALYRGNLENMFTRCDGVRKPKIHFEESRAFIEFVRDSSAKNDVSRILPAVYLAIRTRQLRVPLELQLLDADFVRQKMQQQLNIQQDSHTKALQRLRTNRVKAVSDGAGDRGEKMVQQVALPTPHQTIVPIYITEILNCGHFWAHYGDEDTWRELSQLHQRINQYRGENLKPLPRESVSVGSLCLAPYEDETREYYRARIENLDRERNPTRVQLFYPDYGNVDMANVKDLRVLERDFQHLDFQAFECELCGVKPSAIKCPNARWTEEAKQRFVRLTVNNNLFAKVYSIVHDVIRVDLYEKLPSTQDLHINQELIALCYADKADESLISKRDHVQREELALAPPRTSFQGSTLGDSHVELSLTKEDVAELRTLVGKKRGSKVILNGPWSPYEMNFYSMTNVGRLRAARIEQESVNTVALDDEPHDSTSRMMVAAYVGLNPSGTVMMARDSTIMPNIPGLPALVTLLFAPSAELRTDPARTQYTGALCGLGWDENSGGPALPDHDIEIAFDVKFDVEDLSMINGVRIAINIAVGSENSVADWGPDAVIKIQTAARDKLLRLIKKRREHKEPKYFSRPHMWNQVAAEDLLHPQIQEMAAGTVLLNLHCGIVLNQTDSDDEDAEATRGKMLKEKKKHIEELHSKASRSTERENIECLLCKEKLHSPRELMLHLATRGHCQQETALLL